MLVGAVLQENDVERAANLDRQQWDYYLEESWRWAIAGAVHFQHLDPPVVNTKSTDQPLLEVI